MFPLTFPDHISTDIIKLMFDYEKHENITKKIVVVILNLILLNYYEYMWGCLCLCNNCI